MKNILTGFINKPALIITGIKGGKSILEDLSNKRYEEKKKELERQRKITNRKITISCILGFISIILLSISAVLFDNKDISNNISYILLGFSILVIFIIPIIWILRKNKTK